MFMVYWIVIIFFIYDVIVLTAKCLHRPGSILLIWSMSQFATILFRYNCILFVFIQLSGRFVFTNIAVYICICIACYLKDFLHLIHRSKMSVVYNEFSLISSEWSANRLIDKHSRCSVLIKAWRLPRNAPETILYFISLTSLTQTLAGMVPFILRSIHLHRERSKNRTSSIFDDWLMCVCVNPFRTQFITICIKSSLSRSDSARFNSRRPVAFSDLVDECPESDVPNTRSSIMYIGSYVEIVLLNRDASYASHWRTSLMMVACGNMEW